jgi:hypothetical protein
MVFGCLDVFNAAGLEPLAAMRQARQAVLFECLVPKDLD